MLRALCQGTPRLTNGIPCTGHQMAVRLAYAARQAQARA